MLSDNSTFCWKCKTPLRYNEREQLTQMLQMINWADEQIRWYIIQNAPSVVCIKCVLHLIKEAIDNKQTSDYRYCEICNERKVKEKFTKQDDIMCLMIQKGSMTQLIEIDGLVCDDCIDKHAKSD